MWALELRRWRHKAKVQGTALAACWDAPLPSANKDWDKVDFLVCDAEMSSLDVNTGELLSLGWVGLENGCVALDSARHYLVKPDASVGQSAVIHQMRDCELNEGKPAAEVLESFLKAAHGRVLVFHNAALDTSYLDRSCVTHFGAPLLMPTVDTLALEHAKLQRADQAIKSGDLRLGQVRTRYNLPDYPGHNALVDALATAELLLAQAKHRGGKSTLKLGDLL